MSTGSIDLPSPPVPAQPALISPASILTESLDIWVHDFVTFLMVTVPLMIPVAAAVVGEQELLRHIRPEEIGQMIPATYAVAAIALIFTQIAQGALAWGVIEAQRGKRPTVGGCLRIALRRAVPIVGTSLLAGIWLTTGFLLFCVPGVFLTANYAVAVPVAAVERAKAKRSLRRSTLLTKDNRLAILLVLFAVFVPSTLAHVAADLVSTLTLPFPAAAHLAVSFVVELFAYSVPTTLHATVAALLYYRLRELKEGIDAEQLVKAFD